MDLMDYNLETNISIVRSEKGNFITINLNDFIGIELDKIDIEIYSNITRKHSIFSIHFSEGITQVPFVMYSICENELLFIKLKYNKHKTIFTFYDVNKSLFKENITMSIEEKELGSLSVLTLEDDTSDINYLENSPNGSENGSENGSDNEKIVHVPIHSNIPSYADIFYRPIGTNYNKINVTKIEELIEQADTTTETLEEIDFDTLRVDSKGDKDVRNVNTWRHGHPVGTETEEENEINDMEVLNKVDTEKKEDLDEEDTASDEENAIKEANKYIGCNGSSDSYCSDSEDE